ncbi:helix-turn-helix domain-containing protein [Epibacterium sp. SM1979]|uniref:Helix-turn-helix domain-containing protein n=1 Tax=Tritonibacter litoralis TaxID=2662264 RepID=A0A843YLJ2_9RHOB|nr:helix-turn-helix transcriptional regulator [Tritonibacter litoralis]MQQ10668.1 helix-turn-helix domain-containing protein [Tritonibacter litoralis]
MINRLGVNALAHSTRCTGLCAVMLCNLGTGLQFDCASTALGVFNTKLRTPSAYAAGQAHWLATLPRDGNKKCGLLQNSGQRIHWADPPRFLRCRFSLGITLGLAVQRIALRRVNVLAGAKARRTPMHALNGFEMGLATMAGFALFWRTIGHPERRPLLLPLVVFQFGLLSLGLLDSAPPGVELTLTLALSVFLPMLLQLHMNVLTNRKLAKRTWLWISAAVLPLPFLLQPRVRQDMILQGELPGNAAGILVAFCISLFALIALLASVVLTISVMLRWFGHRRLLRQIYTQPARGERVVTFSLIMIPVGVLVAYLLSLVAGIMGLDVDDGWLERAMISFACIGFAAHGMTIERLPSWAMDLVQDIPEQPQRPAYERSGLGVQDLDAILIRLDSAMAQGQLWLDPMLTLKDLAEAVGVKPSYLSQALNQQRKVTFYDYVNAHRIEDASARLIASNDTILDICFAVGFNAKSTFNAAFRKHKGETPSAWRKRQTATEPNR